MKQFSPALSLEESIKYDFLTNKKSKYLLYKFNDWIESLNAEQIKIRHSSVDRDGVGLTEIQKKKKKKDNQPLIEKAINEIEKTNPYTISTNNFADKFI